MKLRTEIDFDPVTPFLHVPGDPKESCIDDICKDAMAAHALMMAMEEFDGAEYQRDYILHRADELMAEWGFDSGEEA